MCRGSLKTCLNYDGTSNKKLMVRTVCARFVAKVTAAPGSRDESERASK